MARTKVADRVTVRAEMLDKVLDRSQNLVSRLRGELSLLQNLRA